jgi:hypothetical protein
MDLKTTLFFAAFALYVTAPGAQVLTSETTGHCATAGYDGACDIEARNDYVSKRRYVTLKMPGQPAALLVTDSRSCTANGLPCIETPATRPGAVRYQLQAAGFLEFTAPKE